eukprot:GHRR01016180.1.p1 GENE.GHRR01016180.1~~GHRR01016180.1.p1  ORF type:complete len:339 (+),score=80.31 GHRR01016180.1:166-1182(+)
MQALVPERMYTSGWCAHQQKPVPHCSLHTRQQIRKCRIAAVDPDTLIIQPSTPGEYFPAADLHATCFDHDRGDPSKAIWQRFERIWALQINDNLVDSGAGRCTLLIAYDPSKAPNALLDASASNVNSSVSPMASSSSVKSYSSSQGSAPSLPDLQEFAFPQLGFWLSRMVNKQVWPRLGQRFEQAGIIGVAQVDSFGDIIPPKTLSATRDGAFGWIKREGIAYISNVAVSPAARRRGVAVRLMREAEALAAAWGCTRAGLHCNPSNAAAMQLYKQLSYRKAMLEAPWMPYLQGRAPDRCYLMLKRLTQYQQQFNQHAQQQEASSAAVLTPSPSLSVTT